MFDTQNVLPELIVSERMSILQKNPQISVISIIKNHPSKLPFGLKHYSALLVESFPNHGWTNY